MKKIEIKRLDPKSAFRAVLISAAIPYIVLFALIIIGGVFNQEVGKTLAAIIPLILAPVFYGLIAMLFVASYNWLAPKFGGLIMETREDES